mmetsp:Transcript_2676/g.5653  ORF Transcript_2676/g.5653 Transcript_2676/m.5653 type:complete len:743 (+) Transcript_2676:331-2559(+)
MEETQTLNDKESPPSPSPEVPTGEALVEAVRKQLEYYFSRENLQSDPFLTSQMDAQMSVAFGVVMKFAKMKALTQDEAVVRQALTGSSLTLMENTTGNRIKANIKAAGRTTIILREIPSTAPVEEVREIFAYPGAKVATSIRCDVGDTWFVFMESEEDAKHTLIALRTQKRQFRGIGVKARLKTETVVRSFYPLQTPGIPASSSSAPMPYPVMPYPGMPMGGMNMGGMNGLNMGNMGMMMGGNMGAGVVPMGSMPMPGGDMRAFGYMGNMGMPMPPNGNVAVAAVGDAAVKGAETSPGAGKGAPVVRKVKMEVPVQGAAKRRERDVQGQAGAQGAQAGARKKEGEKKDRKEPTIEISLAAFPPLGDDGPAPSVGYKGAYVKYSYDEIVSAARAVKVASLPVEVLTPAHPLALTELPNMDLLKRQRSFSIDETREQLRQGKPVAKAITPGKVNPRTLLCGDEDGAEAPTTSTTTSTVTFAAAPVFEEVVAVADLTGRLDAVDVDTELGPRLGQEQAARIPSASSWAAMLKSSSPASVFAPVFVPRARVGAVAVPVAGVGKLAVKKGAKKEVRVSREGSREGRDKPSPNSSSNRRRDEPSPSRPETSNPAAVAVAGAVEGAVSRDASTSTSAGAVVGAGAAAPSWGGKLSFATVLRQASEAATTTAPIAAAPSKAVSSGTQTAAVVSGVLGAVVAGGEDKGLSKDAAAAAGGEWSSLKPRGVGAKGGGANAKGVWAKETLPALP